VDAGVKVVHVVRQFSPSVGGLEDVVLNLVRFQREVAGHEVRVVTLNRLFRGDTAALLPSRECVDGIDVVRIPFRGSSRYPVAPAVLRELVHADLVHVHAIDFFFDFLAWTKPLHRKPLVVSTHGGFFHTQFASGFKQIYFSTISRLSTLTYARVLATSYNDGEIFSRIVRPPKLQVIENGVDVGRFVAAASSDVPRTLIYFGRWSVNKGLPELIRLFTLLRGGRPDWRLILAGREYDLAASDLRQLARAEGVEGQVEIHANPSVEQLRGLMGGAGYFCSLSHHEGFGLTAIEALSAGLLPVLSDIPAYRRVVEQSGLGLLCGSGDLAATARALESGHEAVCATAQTWREKALSFAQQYAWNQVGRKYEEVYQDVVGGQS
jgi:alpha-1,3-mannosyltransferase